ncbi:DUF4278 domain-containing protein [Vacuolonema iberomarrocanum]|nr:DUF4278 domain-containing protein [filamentous cyanobacterium LEGE 07170]
MKLNYRGIKYDVNPKVLGLRNSNPANAQLKYRGNNYKTNVPADEQK